MRLSGLVFCAVFVVWVALLTDVRRILSSPLAAASGRADAHGVSPVASSADPRGANATLQRRASDATAAPTLARRVVGPRAAPWSHTWSGPTPSELPQSWSQVPEPRRGRQRAGDIPRSLGEQGEAAHSRDFQDLAREYSHEEREAEWADATEASVSALFADRDLVSKLVLLNCQTRTCKMVLEETGPEHAAELLSLPGMRDVTGLRPDSPYSLRAGQLSLYFGRASDPEGSDR